MKKVLKAKHKNFFVKINSNHFELKSKKGICLYLSKDNSCSIHNSRPTMRKCWPVYINFKGNKRKYILADCPLTLYLSKKGIVNTRKKN